MVFATHNVILFLRLVICIVLIVGVGAHFSLAEEIHGTAEDLADKVQLRYEKTMDFSADFSQTLLIEGFQTPMQSSGRVSIKKPGRLYWEYRHPHKESIYVDGERVTFYIPAHNQMIQSTLSQLEESRAPLHLLQGATQLREYFSLESVQWNVSSNGGLHLLSLRLKKDGRVDSERSIVIGVDRQNYYIQTLVMYEPNGNVTTIHFSNVKANSNLPDSLFQCEMPMDVEIIQDLP